MYRKHQNVWEIVVKIIDQNKRNHTAGTNSPYVVPRTWRVKVKETYVKTLSTATITQNMDHCWEKPKYLNQVSFSLYKLLRPLGRVEV